jgi:amino acid transporter
MSRYSDVSVPLRQRQLSVIAQRTRQGLPVGRQERAKIFDDRVGAGFARTMLRWTKRLLVGRPLRNERLGETLLPKKLALPVFCSDPLSSNAYATEEILRALSLGGLALFFLTPWVALMVVVLLAVVVASYRQTCHAYPNGGGAYAVSRANLGRGATLVAASALLVDYVLTVAVSVAAGVDAITSAVLTLRPHAVLISLLFVGLLTVMNLRGVKESGTIFAIPTYGFIAVVFAMIGWGACRALTGHTPTAESATFGITATHQVAGAALVLLALRAFAQGCTALTGVEAVSNGVPHFKEPRSRNAANTLAIMGGVTIEMFAGITALALVARVRVAEDPAHLVGAPAGYEQRTAIAQVAGAVFGYDTVFFLLVQGFTAAILILAANTAFNGFPILASILGNDGYLPKQFARRVHRSRLINGAGAALTGVVLVVVLVTKFTHGAWLVVIAMPAIFLLMRAIARHYRRVAAELTPEPGGGPVLEYVAALRRDHPRDLVVVYLPEYVVGHWWEHLLHNQSALRLKARLLFQRGVMVTNVPWQLASSRAHEQETGIAEPEPVPAGRGRITKS